MTAVLVWKRRLYGGVLGLSGRIHNLFNGSFVPCHTIVLLYNIKYLYFSYDNFQPEYHNTLMETKEVWARPGMMCDHVAALGRHGISKLPVFVDCIVFTSRKFMTSGRVSG